MIIYAGVNNPSHCMIYQYENDRWFSAPFSADDFFKVVRMVPCSVKYYGFSKDQKELSFAEDPRDPYPGALYQLTEQAYALAKRIWEARCKS